MNFLEESFQLLGLTDITAIHGRAEEYARNKEYREQYDLCVSRAVSNLATLSEYCLPYVKKEEVLSPISPEQFRRDQTGGKGYKNTWWGFAGNHLF